jgi:hypothetical protein
MVDQTQAAYPGSLMVRREPRLSAARASVTEPVLTAPWLLLAVVACLLIPGNFVVAGVQLSAPRLLLLALSPFLAWRWLSGAAGRPTAVDILMLLSATWGLLALLANHGLGGFTRGVILGVELFGGYLVGRMLIRNTADYRRFFVLITCGFIILFPFAVIEMLTGQNLLWPLFNKILNMPPQEGRGMRLGMTRAQTVFEHPILFGIVSSLTVANVLYIFRDKLFRSIQLAAFFIFMAFTAISSGPMISIGLQLAMTAWDRFFWFLRFRWLILAGLAVLVLITMKLFAEFHLLDFIIENFMFDPMTANVRLIILEYGSAEVIRHPIFGIGLDEWVRPWYTPVSLDNFWLGQAMRFGLPTTIFLFLAIAVSFVKISSQADLTYKENNYRTGHLITLIGTVITLGTVYIWGATSMFIYIYIGAGAMFYTQSREGSEEAAVRERRIAQAKRFDVGPGSVQESTARGRVRARPPRGVRRRVARDAQPDLRGHRDV